MLIAWNSSQGNPNASLQLPQPEEDIGEDESRLADEARTRQRLAIHSLIRRAEFVDDSNEVTSPAPPSEPRPPTSTNSLLKRLQQRTVQRGVQESPNSKGSPQNTRPPTAVETTRPLPQEQSDRAAEVPSNEPTNLAEADQSQWLDGMRFAFNPWMGWPETLETYGFSHDLDDDYV